MSNNLEYCNKCGYECNCNKTILNVSNVLIVSEKQKLEYINLMSIESAHLSANIRKTKLANYNTKARKSEELLLNEIEKCLGIHYGWYFSSRQNKINLNKLCEQLNVCRMSLIIVVHHNKKLQKMLLLK